LDFPVLWKKPGGIDRGNCYVSGGMAIGRWWRWHRSTEDVY
jgi:hypothetical protein